MPKIAITQSILVIALSLFAALTSISAQELVVQSISPAQNSVGASPAAAIRIMFDENVDAATIDADSVRVFGRWSGVVNGLRTVQGNLLTFTPTRPYFPSETVTITLSSDLSSTGGDSLSKGFVSEFWAASMPGSGNFTFSDTIEFRRQGEGAITTYGFSAIDINRDGSPDISATNESAGDVRSLINDGCGNFSGMTVHPLPGNQVPSPNESADFNRDGWPDLVTGNWTGNSVAVLMNDGAGSYMTPILYDTGGSTQGLAVLDANGDGHTDVVASNLSGLVLFLNDGTGVLAQSGQSFDGGGSGEWKVSPGDANNDGVSDIFVTTRNDGKVSLLLGDGSGGFSVSDTEALGGSSWGLALGDLNLDGNLDAVATRTSPAAVAVLFGDGMGGLSAPDLLPTDAFPESVDVGDLDGDGDLDITCSNFTGASCTVYKNDGSGAFPSPLSLPVQLSAACSVLMDHDRDGDTDIMIIDELADKCFIWEQDGPSTPGVQQASCEAALRLNGYAGANGFGTQAAVEAPVNSFLFINTSGTAGAAYALVLGTPSPAGLDLGPSGILNLGAPLFFLINGFLPPGSNLNANGEALLSLPLPPTIPIGLTFTLQGLVQAPGKLALTNAETLTVVL